MKKEGKWRQGARSRREEVGFLRCSLGVRGRGAARCKTIQVKYRGWLEPRGAWAQGRPGTPPEVSFLGGEWWPEPEAW